MKLLVPKSEDIITFKGDMVLLAGEQISNMELQMMAEEAYALSQTKIWKILTSTVAEVSRQTMFDKAKSWDNVLTGQGILYATDLQQRIIEKIIKTNSKLKKGN